MGLVWDWFGALTLLSSLCLLFLSVLFVRARRSHFAVAFALYTAASGAQKLVGGIFIYMVPDAEKAQNLLFFIMAGWFWLPANAAMVHAIAAYAFPNGRPPRWVVAGIYAFWGLVAVACLVMPVLNLALFNVNWYVFCALSVVLFAQGLWRERRAKSAVERTEARYLWIYLLIGTSFTIEGLYLWLVLGVAALWEIALAYAVATLVMLYAILRHEVFAIDLYAKRATYYTVVSGVVAVSFVMMEHVLQNVLTVGGGSGIFAGIGAAVLIAPVAYVARRPVDRLFRDVRPSEGYLNRRKHEVYRAQLEVALADGEFTANENAVLRRARETLGISAAQHQRYRDEILRAMKHAAAGKEPSGR